MHTLLIIIWYEVSRPELTFVFVSHVVVKYRLHGRVVKGVGHLGHDEAMEAGGREFSLHGRVVKGVGHLGHDEAMEA